MVNELLARHLTRLAPSEVMLSTPEEMYPVLASECASLQQAAYQVLSLRISQEQETVSLEAALSKSKEIKLPEELLSLILAVPLWNHASDFDRNTSQHIAIHGYLLTWKLVFDHWKNASYVVQNSYVKCIKDGTYLPHLMNFTFEYLLASRKSPVTPSQLEIDDYSLSGPFSIDEDIQWLLTNLYYHSLLHLPTLTRAWFRDECPRQLQGQVEEWTTKWVSETEL